MSRDPAGNAKGHVLDGARGNGKEKTAGWDGLRRGREEEIDRKWDLLWWRKHWIIIQLSEKRENMGKRCRGRMTLVKSKGLGKRNMSFILLSTAYSNKYSARVSRNSSLFRVRLKHPTVLRQKFPVLWIGNTALLGIICMVVVSILQFYMLSYSF